MSLVPMQSVLEDRLNELRARIRSLRGDIVESSIRLSKRDQLNIAEENADKAQIALERAAATMNTAEIHAAQDEATAALKSAEEAVAMVAEALLMRMKWWTGATGAYAIVILVLATKLALWCWYATTAPPAGENLLKWSFITPAPVDSVADPRWLAVRAVLLAAFAGMAGAATNIGWTLADAIGRRTFDARRVLWYALAPFFGAALAAALYVLIRGGLLGISISGATTGNGVGTSAAVLGLSFLIGLVPNTVQFRLLSVVKALFGTDEVNAPQVSAPTLKRSGGKVTVTNKVIPSAATRLTSVHGVIITSGGQTSFGMSPGTDGAYTGEFAWAVERDTSGVFVLVEARDESGNVSRSTQVALTAALTPTGGVDVPLIAGTVPTAGGTLSTDGIPVIRFSRPVQDATPVLMRVEEGTEVGTSITWNDGHTEIRIQPSAALTPGEYTLVLEEVTLQDGTRKPAPVEVTFTVV